MYDPERITYFAETDFRNKKTPFGIKAKDRPQHVYVIGKTGMGKSTMLENMAVQDIANDEGFAFIDPHGSTAEKLLEYVPRNRIDDILYFAPFDLNYPISFNVMEDVGADKRHLVANGLMSAFKKIWVDMWSARMEYILNNTILALLEYPGSTILSINRMFADKDYRKEVVSHVTDSAVKSFWEDEFAGYTDRFAAEATPAIQNKVGQFISNPLVRNIIGQPKSSFDLRKMMDEKKIVIINLSKGRMGEDNANLLGSMLITKIYLSAMSRADLPPGEIKTLPNFYLYVDEFQSFANESFANILSEARKYKLNLTMAHQYIEQMSDEVRAAVFGNVGTMIAFRVGAYDAEIFEKEFAPQFTAEDLVNLGFAQIYLKLMIDGVSSMPFSATTLPPIASPKTSYVEEIVKASRDKYAIGRDEVEGRIRAWHEHRFGSGKGSNKKGRGGKKKQSPEEKEKQLREVISLAKLEGSSKGDKKDDKGPSKKNLKELENVIEGKGDGGEKGDEEYVPLEKLAGQSNTGGGSEGVDKEKKASEDNEEEEKEIGQKKKIAESETKLKKDDPESTKGLKDVVSSFFEGGYTKSENHIKEDEGDQENKSLDKSPSAQDLKEMLRIDGDED